MAEAEAAPAEQSALKIIDWEEAMTQVGGDEEFLNEVLQDLLTGETTVAAKMKGDRGLGGGATSGRSCRSPLPMQSWTALIRCLFFARWGCLSPGTPCFLSSSAPVVLLPVLCRVGDG